MSRSIEELKKSRAKLRKREDHVERLARGAKLTLVELGEELLDIRGEITHVQDRRQALKEAIEEEIRADDAGKGEHTEHWEDWVETRRDELADMLESYEGQIERLVRAQTDTREERSELAKRNQVLDKRIEVINKKIARIKDDRKGDLTKDFHIAEFDCRNGTPVPSYMEASLRSLCQEHLQPLRDSGGTVSINSGYRTAAYNAAIGGATQSYHIYDLRKDHPAADHIQVGRPASAVQQWHDAHNPPDGMGYYAGFTHIDDRGYRSRWWGAA